MFINNFLSKILCKVVESDSLNSKLRIFFAKLLLICRADPNSTANSHGYTILRETIFHNDTKMAKLLLNYGANPNIIVDQYGYTPLHHAVLRNNIEMTKSLLAHGANVDTKDNKEKTPLDWAKIRKNGIMVRLLHKAARSISYDKQTLPKGKFNAAVKSPCTDNSKLCDTSVKQLENKHSFKL